MDSQSSLLSSKRPHEPPSVEDLSENSFKKNKSLNHELFRIVEFYPCDDETGQALKDLVDEGADINFEDPDRNEMTLLAFAVVEAKFDFVPLLLELKADIQKSDKSLKENNNELVTSDYAWNSENYEIVSLLLENDAAFPKDFSTQVDSFENVFTERSKFHEDIISGEMEEVKKFVEDNPKLKCAYDSLNHCALSSALSAKKFEIYCFLHFQGFRFGVYTEYKTIMKALSKYEKSELDHTIGTYFKSKEDRHIHKLVLKSQIGHKNDPEDFKKITGFYESLNEIEKIKPILKIAASSVESIVFDFKKGSIRNLHWTGSFCEDVNGRTYYDRGQIMVGAKRDSEEVLGTLAHELTHLALNVVYKNKCLPFFAHDIGRKQEFEEIVYAYDTHEIKSKSDVIANAYGSNDLHIKRVELIVRVNHLIALHHHEAEILAKVRDDVKDLFAFYSDCVLPDLQAACCEIGTKQEIKKINESLKLISEIESFPLATDKVKFNLNDLPSNKNVSIQCDVPELVLQDLIAHQSKRGDLEQLHIFLKKEQLQDSQKRPKILDLYHSRVKPKIFILCTKAENEDNFDQILSMDRVVLISKIPIPISLRKVLVKYNWRDLTSDSKKRFLQTNIQFQGHKIALNDILSEDSEIFNELPLKQILELSQISIESIQKSSKIYIERTFQTTVKQSLLSLTTSKQSLLSAEKIVDYFNTSHTLILSDSAGSGKSMSAKNLAQKLKQKYPFLLVVFVDLKLYTKLFQENDQKRHSITVKDLITDKLLKLDGVLKIKLRLHCYKNKKTVFIFDGFDEICPTYRTLVLNLIATVQASGNSLIVTTRTSEAKVLENELSTKAIELTPFNEKDQREFLIRYWKSLGKTPQDEKALTEKSTRLLGQKSIPKDFLQNPLQLNMFAAIHEKSDSASIDNKMLNTYSLYYSFVERKIEIWLSKGPAIVKEAADFFQKSICIIEVHQKLALDFIFEKHETELLKLPQMKDASSSAVINRLGLIKIENDIQFTHQTLIEYFIANFIVNNVTRNTSLSSRTTIIKLFLKVLKTVEYQKIRKFINDGLETIKEKREDCEMNCLSAKFQEIFKDKSNHDVLERIVIEKQTCLLTFFFQDLELTKDTKLNLLKCKNKEKSEILHVAASYFESFEALWKCIRSFTEWEDQKILLQAKGAIGRNVLGYAVLNEKVLKFFLENILVLMNSQEWLDHFLSKDQESNTALHIIAKNRHSTILDELWQVVEKKLTKPEQKTWFKAKGAFNETILQSLVRDDNIKILPAALRVMTEIFDENEVRDFLLTGDFSGSTVLHNAARFSRVEVLDLIWDFAKESLSEADQKELLMETTMHDHNIFIKAFQNYEKEMVKFVFNIASSILEPEQLWKVLKSRNYYGKSILTLTSEITAEIFPPDLIVRIEEELSKDIEEENVAVLNELASKIKADIHASTLKALMRKEVENKSMIQFAVQLGSVNLVKRLLSLFSQQLNQNEIAALFLPDLMHFSLYNDRNNHEVSKLLWSFVVETLPNTVIEVLSGLDERNRTMIVLGVEVNCPTTFEFVNFYKNYNNEAFKNLFFKTNESGEILLHHVGRYCNVQMAEVFFNLILKSPFTEDERKNILLTKNALTLIPLLRAMQGRDECTFTMFYKSYLDILNRDGLKNILFHDDFDYFNHGNYKTEKLVNLLRELAIEDFGFESVNEVVENELV